MMRIMNKTGQELVWHYFNTLTHDADGNAYVLGHAHDVTTRVRAERELSESERRFRDFAETAADFFWEQDASLRFTFVSKRSYAVLGVSRRNIIGASWDELLSAHGDADGTSQQDLHTMAAGAPFNDVEVRWTRPDGETRFMRVSGRPVYDESGAFSGYRGVSRDVTQSHQLTEQIAYQASHDHLTGLLNRREFESRVEGAVATTKERGNQHAVCYMDLDQFKLVNDTAGHSAGDELLRSLVDFLQHLIRRGDTLARLGGDEFGLLLENCSQSNAIDLAQSIVDCVRRFRFAWNDQNFTIGISIGVVPINANTDSAIQVMSQGDVACYTAKDMGRNRIHIYDANGSEPASFHKELFQAADLREALTDDRFEIHAQPIYYIGEEHKSLHHYELLIRLVDKSGNLVAPGKFLPAAERYGMMSAVDRWVVKYACRTFGSSIQLPPDVGLSINLSRSSLLDEPLIDEIIHEIGRSPLLGKQICFEISESAASLNLSDALRNIEQLKTTGCEVALDDFGSGLSSFAYLKSLPVDYLKIDGSFIQDMANDSIDRSMITMINDVGHMIGTQTVAKSVENEKSMVELKKLGIDFIQGFYCGRPVSVDELFKSAPLLRDVSR
jgi:diguanylate cyclase (GGDEF)-like protein/PAS domain S-box-containing protein